MLFITAFLFAVVVVGTGAVPVVVPDASGSAAGEPTGVDAVTILPKFGEMATSFETKQGELLERQAQREEHAVS